MIGKFGLSFVAAVALTAGASFSNDPGEASVVTGVGASPCSVYLKTKDNEVLAATYRSWAMGFLSGINMPSYVNKEGVFDLKPVDEAFVSEAIEKHCLEKPDDNIFGGLLSALSHLDVVPSAY